MFKDKKAAVMISVLLTASLVSGCGSTIIAGTNYAEAFPTPPAGSADGNSLSDEESAEAFTAMTEGSGTMADFLNETEGTDLSQEEVPGTEDETPAEDTSAAESAPTPAPTPVPQQPTPVPQQPQPQPQTPQPQPTPAATPAPTPTPAKQRIWIDPVTEVIDHPEQGHYETTSVQKVKCQCGAVFNSAEEQQAHQNAWIEGERARLNDPSFDGGGAHSARYFSEEEQHYVVDTPAWQETVVVEEGHWEYVD